MKTFSSISEPSFLFKQKSGGNVGAPYVCCDYHLVNKETA